LKTNNGTIISDQNSIMEETKSFYTKLYTKRDTQHVDLTSKFKDQTIPKLTEKESSSIEGNITKAEALDAIKHMKNDKSPGSDGFTAEFLKKNWKNLGSLVH
jgi:hypothetical protein